jgi:hypothetical protein
MFTEDDREVHNREQEAGLVLRDSSDKDIIFVVHSLIEQNSELARKLEETSCLAKVAQEQIAESVRQRDISRMEAERIMAEARQLADKYFQEKVLLTEQEAKEIIKSAEAKAEAITGLAELEAKRIIDEAKQTANNDRHATQRNKGEAGVETKRTKVVALGKSSDKVSTGEGQDQYWQRYIWDSTKLAWVEAGEPGISQPLVEVLNAPDIDEAGKKPIEQRQSVTTMEREAKDNEKEVKLYRGPVEMVVKSHPGSEELRKFSKHLRNLKSTHDIRLLEVDSSGSYTIMRLFLKTSIPLLDILKTLPEVHTLYDDLKDGGKPQRARFERDKLIARSIIIELRRWDIG